jgi:hypothetical protein
MMRALSLPLIAAIALAAGAPAVAAPATPAAPAAPKATPTNEDIRCLMVMFALSQDKARPQAAQSGQIGIFFFAGRLSIRAPGADLGPIMKAEAPTLTGPALQTELQRCAPLIQTAQTGLQAGIAALRPPAPPAGAAPAAPATPPPK